MKNTEVPLKILQPTRIALLSINGTIGRSAKERFKDSLRGIRPRTHVVLRIDAYGEDFDSAARMIHLIQLYKKQGCRFVVHINRAYGAALLIALAGDERVVTKKSRGKIQSIPRRQAVPGEYDRLQEWQYGYLNKIGGLSKEFTGYLTKRHRLNADSMLQFGIATRRIEF